MLDAVYVAPLAPPDAAMKIEVDNKGWAVVVEPAEGAAKTGSGVYPKSTDSAPGHDGPIAPVTDVSALGEALTEPSIPSEEAIHQGAAPLPPPSALPADLLALATGNPKVA